MSYSTTDIINIIKGVINNNSSKVVPIPSPLILVGGSTKKGLSAREMGKEVILRMQEAGAPIGNLPDGGESIAEKMEIIRMEVLLKHLLENAKITVVIPAGIPVTVSGTNAGGPVVCAGTTTFYSTGYGLIQ